MNKLQIAIQDIKYMPKTVGFVLKSPFILLVASLLTLVSVVVGLFANIDFADSENCSYSSFDDDYRTSPTYSFLSGNIWHSADD
jgi:hypothetical protein